jgi:hypothetical protein
MTNNDPNYPWLALPKQHADVFNECIGLLGATEAMPCIINLACDKVAQYGRERFDEGARLGNHSVLGRNGVVLSKWLPKAIEAVWANAPKLGTGDWAQYIYLWSAMQELQRVSLQACSFDTFEPPTIEAFVDSVRESAETAGGAA